MSDPLAPDPGSTGSLRTFRARGAWVAYRFVHGVPPALHATVAVAEAVRGAILRWGPSPISPWISGHHGNQPFEKPHLAFVPIPAIAPPLATGHLAGFALSLPESTPHDAVLALGHALRRWEAAPSDLHDGCGRRVELGSRYGARLLAERESTMPAASAGFLPHAWRGPAARWATLTPLAVPGACDPLDAPLASQRVKAHRTARKLARLAFLRAFAHPDPRLDALEVEVHADPPIPGGPTLDAMPRFQRVGHATLRRIVHATFSLPEDVAIEGPLSVGAAHHFGLGLCAPLL